MRPGTTPWTPEEDAFLLQQLNTNVRMSAITIEGRTLDSINKRAQRLRRRAACVVMREFRAECHNSTPSPNQRAPAVTRRGPLPLTHSPLK